MRRRIWKTLFPWRSGRSGERVTAAGVSHGNSLSGTPAWKAALDYGLDQYERIICASNAVICISGDVRKEEVLPLLEKHLGGMRADASSPDSHASALRAGREVAVLG